MDTKRTLILGASVVIAGLALGLTLSANHPPSVQPAQQVGRFQMCGVPGRAYVIDTVTGQVWEEWVPAIGGKDDEEFKKPKLK